MPPVDSTATLNKASQWSIFQAEVEKYATRGKIKLCGDLNARTGNCSDFIPYDSDHPIRSSFRYIVDSAVPRTSKDTTVNTQGRYLLDLCISSRIKVVNGRLDGDPYGDYTPQRCSVVYTCYTLRGAKRLGAQLQLHQELLNTEDTDYAVAECAVLQNYQYTLFIALYIVLSVKHGRTDCREEEEQQNSAAKYHSLAESVLWNEEIQSNFRKTLEENATIQMISEMQSDVDRDNVNASAKKVDTLLKTIIKISGRASTYISNLAQRFRKSTGLIQIAKNKST